MVASRAFVFLSLLAVGASAKADYLSQLIWFPKGGNTCMYGEIEVYNSAPLTYFCGCNWWPSCPAGGYTGIQETDKGRRLMIFSVWDTSPQLKTIGVEKGDPRTVLDQFDSGAHSTLDYRWKISQTYRFFIVKRQDTAHNCTLTSSYFYDDGLGRWVYEATVASPNNGGDEVKTINGMTNAYIQNMGSNRDDPRLAVFRLWTGTRPSDLSAVTEGEGHGKWGTIDDSFFIGNGDESILQPILDVHRKSDKEIVWGGTEHMHIPDQKLAPEIVKSLENLLGIKNKGKTAGDGR